MGLFWRRPLCLACFLFLIVSFLSGYLPTTLKPWVMTFVLAFMLLLLTVLFVRRSEGVKARLFIGFMCVLFVALAMINSYLRIDLPERHAEGSIGKNAVEMTVVSENYSSRYGSEYSVRINQIGKERVSIKGTLVCGFDASLYPFDKLYAKVELSKGESRGGSLLTAYLGDSEGVLCERAENKGFFANILDCGADGIAIGMSMIRERVSEHVKELFGAETGGLAAGLLMNDKSDISTELIRDFRRSGVSHLLAVSGLHISLLVGAAELVLRRLRISKGIKCVALSLAALLLLTLAGFSMSACRSVLMLFVLYLNYMLMEENDSPTSLFFSVFLIVLISPYSIYDLGLFMSFMATLGLVTVYPIFEAFLKGQFKKRLPNNIVTRFIRGVINLLAITVIANIFLLPVMWLGFGEFSLVAFLVNLLVSPIVSLLLPLMALGACVGKLFFVGDAVIVAVKLLTGIFTGIVSYFSRLSIATVSLKYDFVSVILLLFIAAMTVLMVVRLKRKWILAVPPLVSTVAFCVSLAIFNSISLPSLSYYSSYSGDMFFSVNKGKAAIVDFSSGNTRSYMEALDIANEKSAVSVESIFIKDISYSQISAIDYVMKRHVVEKIYLPVPQSESAYYLCAELCELAKKHGVSAELYGAFESVEISEGISVVALQDSDALLACGESVVLYTNQSSLRDTDITKASDVIIFGSQNDASKEGSLTLGKEANVIFSSREAMENSRADFTEGRVYALDGVCCIDLNKLLN